MKAILVRRSGGPETLELAELENPQPGPGELLVAVRQAGVNYRDIYDREGRLPAPLVVGVEGVGEVLAVGDGVTDFRPGERAAWATTIGSYAEQIAVRADRAVPVPDAVDDQLAAAVLLQGMTAFDLAGFVYPIAEGDTVLVHAGAGGVGLLLTQFAVMRGARVLATVSTAEKAEAAREAGAESIGYEDFATRARELTGGEGVAAVFDGVGAATFDGSLAALRPRGHVVTYGWPSGDVPPVDLSKLAAGALSVTRPTMAVYAHVPAELRARAAALFEAVGDGRLRVRVHRRFELAEAAEAHRLLAARETIGKLVLEVS